ncbi:NAD-dependent dihydropyrimidine dehydrogenase subunit PreA [candidate division CSSED10-310 bacterium]|uniref:dihydrouracil dehydrogenase (NAD(+)) n=1 Tax=candidate division CSSED10-310 bacterium TaxID=2855610 RepID=A0ABV6YTL2_UNCC1
MTFRKDLSIDFCGVHFENPVLLSSSPVSNTAEMVERSFEAGFSGVVFKTMSTGAIKIIHPSPRMAPYHYLDKKLMGLQNVEQISDRSMADNLADLKYLKKHWPDKVIISSIMGFTLDEWAELAKASEDVGADMLELNFSCPHMTVEGSGMNVSHAFTLLEQFTEAVKKVVTIPVIAKMTPNITDICEPALFAKQGGADAISAINTVSGIVGIGLEDFTPLPNVFGKGAMSGYSGPAIKPIGLRCVAQLAQNNELQLPLSGIGGIETWVDVVEYMLCGAATVQITTGIIHYGYRIIEDILEGMSYYLAERNIDSIDQVVGKALPNLVPTEQFDLSRQGATLYDLNRCIGCGQCYIICQDAGGQCLSWDGETRQPVMNESLCVGCLICSFVCPIHSPPLITYQEIKNKPEIRPPVSQ